LNQTTVAWNCSLGTLFLTSYQRFYTLGPLERSCGRIPHVSHACKWDSCTERRFLRSRTHFFSSRFVAAIRCNCAAVPRQRRVTTCFVVGRDTYPWVYISNPICGILVVRVMFHCLNFDAHHPNQEFSPLQRPIVTSPAAAPCVGLKFVFCTVKLELL
jgi:hypothetical protein